MTFPNQNQFSDFFHESKILKLLALVYWVILINQVQKQMWEPLVEVVKLERIYSELLLMQVQPRLVSLGLEDIITCLAKEKQVILDHPSYDLQADLSAMPMPGPNSPLYRHFSEGDTLELEPEKC